MNRSSVGEGVGEVRVEVVRDLVWIPTPSSSFSVVLCVKILCQRVPILRQFLGYLDHVKW